MHRHNCTEEQAKQRVADLDLKDQGKKRCKICKEIKDITNFNEIYVDREKKFKSRLAVCTKCKPEYVRNSDIKQRENNYFRYIVSDIKTRAKIKNLNFDLTAEYIEELFKTQKGVCAVTKLPMNFERSGWMKRNPYMASIDRIIPEQGYTKENIRWVLYAVNLALCNWGEGVFKKIAESYMKLNSIKEETHACPII
jgi:hypothetical protein